MYKEPVYLLLTNDPIELKVYHRFSELCDYININGFKRHNYRVFLDNLKEIPEWEYRYIPDETFR